MIERADGTDSRVLGQGLMQNDIQYTWGSIWGPGWSPDGQWFAWEYERFGSWQYEMIVVNVNGEAFIIEHFPRPITATLWHPTDNYLMIYSNQIASDRSELIETFWLYDVDTQTMLVNTSIETIREQPPILYWQNKQVSFYAPNYVVEHYNLVHMHFDGNVNIERVTREDWLSSSIDIVADRRWNRHPLEEPPINPNFTDIFDSDVDVVPIKPVTNTGARFQRSPLSWLWDAEQEWIFLAYNHCVSGGCGHLVKRVSVYNPVTEQYRELSDCGAGYTCIGWLPEHVPIDSLVAGQSESVLFAPEYYFEDSDFTFDQSKYAEYVLDCNITVEDNRYYRQLVRHVETHEVKFVLPQDVSETCSEPLDMDNWSIVQSHRFYFELSPDGQYYVQAQDSIGISSGFKPSTSVHDAQTGEQIGLLNIDARHIWFSEDGKILFTYGTYLGAVWDMEKIIAERPGVIPSN